jgi:hypothetical protein
MTSLPIWGFSMFVGSELLSQTGNIQIVIKGTTNEQIQQNHKRKIGHIAKRSQNIPKYTFGWLALSLMAAHGILSCCHNNLFMYKSSQKYQFKDQQPRTITALLPAASSAETLASKETCKMHHHVSNQLFHGDMWPD